MTKPDHQLVLERAADLLVAAIRLEEFNDELIRGAFKLLWNGNPRVTRWLSTTLPLLLPTDIPYGGKVRIDK